MSITHAPQSESQTANWNFDTSYLNLPGIFYTPVAPTPVALPQLVVFNRELALELGLNAELLRQAESALVFGGNVLPEGATPIAQAYAGHQFGHFTMLGDGRAILLGEHVVRGERLPSRWDIQLKGPGKTPYSRRGDGRAALGPMLREYIISEAMHALGIPTTRSLSVVATGEPVYRENVLPGAVLTRVAASHIRVGTFEFAASQGWLKAGAGKDALGASAASVSGDSRALSAVEGQGATTVQALADYTIHRHYPQLASSENIYLDFFNAVAERQAELIAKWMLVGFIHGVMNTDNMALSGETIDYGPCAFLDAFSPATVFSSIDQQGRYSFGNQPRIASWNLARLAETLLPLFADDEPQAIALAQESLALFNQRFNHHYTTGMRAKLGLKNKEEKDEDLITSLLGLMDKTGADFTNTFRRFGHGPAGSHETSAQEIHSYPGTEPLFAAMEFHSWQKQWQERLARQSITPAEAREYMGRLNPAVIPRNHKVEAALAAANTGDMSVLHKLVAALKQPYVESADNKEYREPGAQGAEPYRTFCGT